MKTNIWIYTLVLIVLLLMVTGTTSKTSAQQRTGTISDIDGNRYRTVVIGEQEWMGENLKVTRLNDGTEIPNLSDNDQWVQVTTPAYSWYDNDISKRDTYGAIYNWHTVNTGKLCPVGWSVSSDSDWEVLTGLLGGANVAGDKLKETGTSHWNVAGSNATNESGFSALPGGYRWSRGKFDEIGINGYWWSGTECTDTHSWSRTMHAGNSKIYRSFFIKNKGFSVRCIKNK